MNKRSLEQLLVSFQKTLHHIIRFSPNYLQHLKKYNKSQNNKIHYLPSLIQTLNPLRPSRLNQFQTLNTKNHSQCPFLAKLCLPYQKSKYD